MPTPKPTFEQSFEIIKTQVEKRRAKWTLSSINWLDFDDISQIIYAHINKKWHLWDHNRPLAPWVSTIASNQISNLIKTHYSNFSRPCLHCPAYEGDNLCSIYEVQCVKCPLYDYWIKNRKAAYDVKITLPIDTHVNEVENHRSDSVDIEKASDDMHYEIKKLLKPVEWSIYKCIYMEHKSEKETATYLGYKTSGESREAGYRTIAAAKKKIIQLATKIAYSGDIEYR